MGDKDELFDLQSSEFYSKLSHLPGVWPWEHYLSPDVFPGINRKTLHLKGGWKIVYVAHGYHRYYYYNYQQYHFYYYFNPAISVYLTFSCKL
jgi:hypothetical protein